MIASYLWNFGDGRTSSEKDPVHTYFMPGKYSWKLTVTDMSGNSVSVTGTVYVYDNDFKDDNLHATYTNKCYRAAVLAKQGSGIVEWGGVSWVWPEAYVGTCKGATKYGENVSLVLNRANGRFYRVGVPEVWQDRVTRYSGSEIECRFKIKEHLAASGEQNMIEHVETHVVIRPYRESYRGQAGYTADGLRSSQKLTLQVYRDGEQNTAYSKVQKAPIYGDYIYGRRAKGKRLQAELILGSSGFRITKVRQLHENCDERVGPKYAVPSESAWQREFSTPDLWLCRNRSNPLRDRATGQSLTGVYSTLTNGPDGATDSGISFPNVGGVLSSLPLIQNGTLMSWVGFMSSVGNLWAFPQFVASIVQIGADYYLRLVGSGLNHSQILSWNGLDWSALAIVLDPTYVKVYENGAQIASVARPGALVSFGGTTEAMQNLGVSAFDIRRVPRAISSDALGYYVDNVINEGGNILPMMK